MVFQVCRLIFATFAIVSYLQAETRTTKHKSLASFRLLSIVVQQQDPALRQDPNTVTIQPSSAGGPRGPGAVVVTVDKGRVRVGERVKFTLTPANVVTNPRYQVTIDFGDGTRRETNQTEIIHQYRATGHYKVYASVVGSARAVGSPDANVQTSPIPRVTLAVSPTTVVSGRQVMFSAQLSSRYPKIKYRFGFGDRSQTDWQDSPETTHSYPAAGRYLAYVDIGVSDDGVVKQVGGSARQPVQVADAPVERVELMASPMPVEARQPVTLNARVSSTDPNIRYRFVFGDGSSLGWQASPQATHAYEAAGTFPAAVEMGIDETSRIRPVASARQLIRVTPPPPVSVTLTANPATVGKGNAVTFIARAASGDSDLRYRFFYGDGSSDWQDSSQAIHKYTVAGNYPAYVEVARAIGGRLQRLVTSSRVQISVGSGESAITSPSPTLSPGSTAMSSPSPGQSAAVDPSPSAGSPVTSLIQSVLRANWWKYLVVALLILLIGYKILKWLFASSPVFRAYADPGGADLEGGARGLSIKSRVILRPDIAGGQYLVFTDGVEVVKNFRREDA